MSDGFYYKHFLSCWILLALLLKLGLWANVYFSLFLPNQGMAFLLAAVALALPASVLVFVFLKLLDAIDLLRSRL